MRVLIICVLSNVSKYIKFNYYNVKKEIISDSNKYSINENLNCLILSHVTDLDNQFYIFFNENTN